MSTATIIRLEDWKNQSRVVSAAKEYVSRFIEYGFESAALWSQDNVSAEDAPLFNRIVREEMRKNGFSW